MSTRFILNRFASGATYLVHAFVKKNNIPEQQGKNTYDAFLLENWQQKTSVHGEQVGYTSKTKKFSEE